MTDTQDIVERLKARQSIKMCPKNGLPFFSETIPDALCREAATEITRLRVEVEGKDALLKEAERVIADLVDHDASYDGKTIHITCDNHGDAVHRMWEARAALVHIREANHADES